MAERVMKVDPYDSDDVAILNGLLTKGYQTLHMIVMPTVDEDTGDEKSAIYYHLKRCDCENCRMERGEIPSYDDDDDEEWNYGNN